MVQLNNLQGLHPARVYQLVRTNQRPTALEYAQLAELSSTQESLIVGLNSQILVAPETTKYKLMSHLSTHSSQLDKYKTITSIVRRVPAEIIGEIFLILTRLTEYPTIHSNHAPLVLCQICSQWRDIAIGHGALWTRFAFGMKEKGAPDVSMQLMMTWLDRASTFSLSIKLSPSHFRDTEPSTAQDPPPAPVYSLEFLFPYIPRCRRLHIHLETLFFFQLQYLPLGSVDFLEVLHLQLEPEAYRRDEPQPIWHDVTAPFQHAPRLRTIYIHAPDSPTDMNGVLFPWSQLTSITLPALRLNISSYMLLRQCVNLEHLSLGLLFNINESDAPGTIFPVLRSLEIDMRSRESDTRLARFLRHFTLPALKELAILSFSSSFPVAEFEALQSRSSFTLTTLKLVCLTIPTEQLKRILQCVPSLRALHLSSCECPSTYFEMLSLSQKTVLVPELEEFAVFDRASESRRALTTDDEIADMVESRWNVGLDPSTGHLANIASPLRKVDITVVGRAPGVEAKERLEMCQEEGLVLVLKLGYSM